MEFPAISEARIRKSHIGNHKANLMNVDVSVEVCATVSLKITLGSPCHESKVSLVVIG